MVVGKPTGLGDSTFGSDGCRLCEPNPLALKSGRPLGRLRGLIVPSGASEALRRGEIKEPSSALAGFTVRRLESEKLPRELNESAAETPAVGSPINCLYSSL